MSQVFRLLFRSVRLAYFKTMESLRMQSCYCISLHTAGIIVNIAEQILAIVSFALVPILVVAVLDIIVNNLWLYGIYVVSTINKFHDM